MKSLKPCRGSVAVRSHVEPLEHRLMLSAVYTAATSFSTTENPNGPWSYGSTASEFAAFTLLRVENAVTANENEWAASATSYPAVLFDKGVLYEHPGATSDSDVRFTAPVAGGYSLATTFSNADKATTDLHILSNGKSLFDGNITATTTSASKTIPLLTLAAGGTIDFIVGDGGDGDAYDKVELAAVITQGTTNIAVIAPAAQAAVVGVKKSFTLGSFTETNATGPYTATVNWGDGTSNTTIKLTAAGTIPATDHTFAAAGGKTVSVTVTDSAGHTSNKATFAVAVAAPTGSISGTVFNDANGNGKKDVGEEGLGLWTVFIDLKKDGKDDVGDPSVTTNIAGAWSFSGLVAGTYTVRVVPVTGSVATTPTGGVETITLTAGESSVGNLFGEKTIA